jgi:hypothetical protein
MDDPKIKRLVITLLVSVAVILVLKMVLLKATKASIAANKAVAEKNHAAAPPMVDGQPAAIPAATPASAAN